MQQRANSIHGQADGQGLPASIVQPVELVGRRLRNNQCEGGGRRGGANPAQTTFVSKGPGPVPDPALVAQAVSWIRSKVAATVKLGALEVGDYVLARFFGNNPDLVRSRDPNKNASFRALAARCGTAELPVSKTWLNNAVGIALVTRLLPQNAQAFRALPPSFQESLLPLSDPAKVERLATKAVAQGLTFRRLRQLVAEERAQSPLVLRRKPAPPSLLKALDRSVRLLGFERGGPAIAQSEIENLDREHRAVAIRHVNLLVESLQELAARLSL